MVVLRAAAGPHQRRSVPRRTYTIPNSDPPYPPLPPTHPAPHVPPPRGRHTPTLPHRTHLPSPTRLTSGISPYSRGVVLTGAAARASGWQVGRSAGIGAPPEPLLRGAIASSSACSAEVPLVVRVHAAHAARQLRRHRRRAVAQATDEYKGSKQGSGNEKLMELQSGQKFRQIRKGPPPSAPPPADTQEEGLGGDGTQDSAAESAAPAAARSSIHVIEATSHLNIAGCTHMHTGASWFKAEQGATDGKMTRFDCVCVDAEYEDLPDRDKMDAHAQCAQRNTQYAARPTLPIRKVHTQYAIRSPLQVSLLIRYTPTTQTQCAMHSLPQR